MGTEQLESVVESIDIGKESLQCCFGCMISSEGGTEGLRVERRSSVYLPMRVLFLHMEGKLLHV